MQKCSKCNKIIHKYNKTGFCKSCAKLGKSFSVEHKIKLSIAKLGKKQSEQQKQRRSYSLLGRKFSNETRLKMSQSAMGRKNSAETILKIKQSKLGVPSKKRGSLSHFWKGGITDENEKIRKSLEYKKWRINVFERDNYLCVICNSSGYLHADHIKPFSLFPELRLDINNGRTLCVPCHRKTETYGGKLINKKLK